MSRKCFLIDMIMIMMGTELLGLTFIIMIMFTLFITPWMAYRYFFVCTSSHSLSLLVYNVEFIILMINKLTLFDGFQIRREANDPTFTTIVSHSIVMLRTVHEMFVIQWWKLKGPFCVKFIDLRSELASHLPLKIMYKYGSDAYLQSPSYRWGFPGKTAGFVIVYRSI